MYLHHSNNYFELITMKINYSKLNSSLDINKRQIQLSIAPKTSKEDKDYKYRIDHIVSVGIAKT